MNGRASEEPDPKASEPGSQPEHRPTDRHFWAKYLTFTLVTVFLLTSGFSQQGGFKLAAPTFGDYWVGVPLLIVGGFLLVGGVRSRSWMVAGLGTFFVIGSAGLLLFVATPDTSGSITAPDPGMGTGQPSGASAMSQMAVLSRRTRSLGTSTASLGARTRRDAVA